MHKVIIFLGPPGSGKGTQAKKIAQKYTYGHISTGDLLRALQAKPHLAPDEAEALKAMKTGKLVPDWLVYRLAFEAIERSLEKGHGVVLDGAIRSVEQAKKYQAFFEEKKVVAEVLAIEIALSDTESLGRLASRRVCSRCGEIIPALSYSAFSVCPKCSGELVTRSDDQPEVVLKRIKEQGNQAIEPLRAYYVGQGVLKTVDGNQTIEQVEQDIEKIICS